MGKINDYTRKFSGKLNDTTVGQLVKQLDYSLDTLSDRMELVKQICENDFFTEYFDTTDKSSITHNLTVCGHEERLESLKEERDSLIKKANQSIIQYKRTRDLSLIELNETLKEQAMEIDAEIESIKKEMEEAYKNIPQRTYFNVHPKCYTEVYDGDPLSADNNVCQALEKMADYILKMDKQKDTGILTVYQIRQKAHKEAILSTEFIAEQEYNSENPQFSLSDEQYGDEPFKGNYKKSIWQTIYKEDYSFTKRDSNKRLASLRIEQLKQQQEAISILKSKPKHPRIDNWINEINKDMVYTKDAYNGTIYFKRVMPDTCDMDENQIDFRDIKHIKALLECVPSSQKWYGSTSVSLEQYLHDIRYKISDSDWMDLQFIRECSRVSYNKLIDETGYSRTDVNASITRIAKLIYKHHMEICQDLWYLNMVKGTYKKCSRCNEIKLVQKFNKHPQLSDGLRPECKECEKKSKK